MSVDIAKYRKMSPEEREEYMFEIWAEMRSDIQKINTRFDNVSPLEKQVKELADNVETSSEAITGLANRMDYFEARIANGKVFAAAPEVGSDIKEEEFTVNGSLPSGFMPGQQRILDQIAQRNKMNSSMPWQRSAGGSE